MRKTSTYGRWGRSPARSANERDRRDRCPVQRIRHCWRRADGQEESVYLQPEDIVGLYAEIFGCSDAHARDQLPELSGLEAALARPESYTHYEQAELPLQAAALAYVGIFPG